MVAGNEIWGAKPINNVAMSKQKNTDLDTLAAAKSVRWPSNASVDRLI